MNGREYFHESVVRDIVDVLTSLKDYDEVQFLKNSSANRSFKSITSATKDLILTFPVLVSSDASPETATMIAKAQEKKCASLLHMLFTAICVDSNEDVFDYVQKFHSNLGSMNGTLEDYADALDRLGASLDESCEFTGEIDHAVLETVLSELKESNYTLPDDIKESSISDYKIIPGYGTGMPDRIVCEADDRYSRQTNNDLDDARRTIDRMNNTINNQRETIRNQQDRYDKLNQQYNARGERIRNLRNDRHNMRVKMVNGNKNGGGSGRDLEQIRLDKMKQLEVDYKLHDMTVLNAEYKKANELMPTMMVVNFIQKGENGSASFTTTAVIGVKCKVYPVSSTDIYNRLTSKVADKNVLNSFIRATTNEIAFFRDFLFAIDKAKTDAMSYGKNATSNKLWKVLERRSTKSKFRRALKMTNDATAITTLVLTANDAEILKKEYNFDIENISVCRKLLDAFNFMCIVIANESTDIASFLYDTGDDNFEKLTFSNLEREASDNGYKKIVNLLTKMNR